MSRKSEKFAATFKFDCSGPDTVGGYSGMKAPMGGLGKQMTIDDCMMHPDCSCKNYREAVDQMEELE